jgi:hypothetical protein
MCRQLAANWDTSSGQDQHASTSRYLLARAHLFDFAQCAKHDHIIPYSAMRSSSRANSGRQPSNLTIQPPSPGLHPPRITTPINQTIPQISSPRKAPLPPSPTYSSHSNLSGLSANDPRSRKGSFDAHGQAPPVPRKDDKRLPGLPFAGLQLHLPRSPRKPRGDETYGQGAGMYDNKLVRRAFSQRREGSQLTGHR